jgi:hypothetical protein
MLATALIRAGEARPDVEVEVIVRRRTLATGVAGAEIHRVTGRPFEVSDPAGSGTPALSVFDIRNPSWRYDVQDQGQRQFLDHLGRQLSRHPTNYEMKEGRERSVLRTHVGRVKNARVLVVADSTGLSMGSQGFLGHDVACLVFPGARFHQLVRAASLALEFRAAARCPSPEFLILVAGTNDVLRAQDEAQAAGRLFSEVLSDLVTALVGTAFPAVSFAGIHTIIALPYARISMGQRIEEGPLGQFSSLCHTGLQDPATQVTLRERGITVIPMHDFVVTAENTRDVHLFPDQVPGYFAGVEDRAHARGLTQLQLMSPVQRAHAGQLWSKCEILRVQVGADAQREATTPRDRALAVSRAEADMLQNQRRYNAKYLAPPEDEHRYDVPWEDERRGGTAQEGQGAALEQWAKAMRATEIMDLPPIESVPWPREFREEDWRADETLMSRFTRHLLRELYEQARGDETVLYGWLMTSLGDLPARGCSIQVTHQGRTIHLGHPSAEQFPGPGVPLREWTCWEERLWECRTSSCS